MGETNCNGAHMQINDNKITLDDGREVSIYSEEGFRIIGELYVRSSWGAKYSYTMTWLGRPIIQLPDDVMRIQEAIWQIKPDVIVETGVAHGGSLILYASLCKTMEKGRVIGVDIEIRPHNRKAVEEHFLSSYITMIEGNSVGDDILAQVRSLIKPGETVMVILDSNHTKGHVLAELHAYAPMVTSGSYIVATDGMMQDVPDAPRGQSDWTWDNPQQAVKDFLTVNSDFVLEELPRLFDESGTQAQITYWPNAYLKRL
jgi:cephalosporin hydroxylase